MSPRHACMPGHAGFGKYLRAQRELLPASGVPHGPVPDRRARFRQILRETVVIEGRGRLLLLALIIIAVAIGTVGITFVSLHDVVLDQQRALLAEMLAADRQESGADRRLALLAAEGAQIRVVDGDVPAGVLAQLDRLPEPGEVRWVRDPDADYMIGLRATGTGLARVAWQPLGEVRNLFLRAAAQALGGMLLLVGAGLILFYRTTAPLLRDLADSEARYRTLFASTAEGILLVGNERIEECNDRVCEMFGEAREVLIGLPWQEFFRRHAREGESVERFLAAGRQAFGRDGEPFRWEFRRGGGVQLVVEVLWRELQVGGTRHVLVSLRDVTQREATERILRDAADALTQARERLARAGRDSALIEFAAGIAHEVNQPLAAIANYAQASRRLLQSGHQDTEACRADVSRALEAIDTQARRAGEAINRIRELVRAPSAGSGLTCLGKLAGEVVELMRPEAVDRGVVLRLSLEQGLPAVSVDAAQIQQVLVQLLRNAIEASRGRGGEVEVAAGRGPEGAWLEVRDRGEGLAPEALARMFEPFFSTRENGMGMGLPVSMSIIRAHGGDLDIHPRDGGGVVAGIRLPAAPGGDEA
jgi:PAS domain S-box-containing protein